MGRSKRHEVDGIDEDRGEITNNEIDETAGGYAMK